MRRCRSKVAKFKTSNSVRRSWSDVAKSGKKSGNRANKDKRHYKGKNPASETSKD